MSDTVQSMVADPDVVEGPVDVVGGGHARAVRRSLAGQGRPLARLWPFLGPAFIAAVAYLDPGNFATNISAGSEFGYLLLWVILVSNLMAGLIQTMSAKLGIATGKNLPEVCRERFPCWLVWALWVQAELIAIATDLAEFVGAALALNLLFHIALFPAGVITAAANFGILELQRRGYRPVEAVISGFLGVVAIGFAYQLVYAGPPVAPVLGGLLTPRFAGTESVFLATGILGATVMPHVIYLHSALTQQRVVGRSEAERKRIFRFELMDVVIAMGIAGAVNGSMLVVAATLFHGRGLTHVGDIDVAFRSMFGMAGGRGPAIMLGVALLASGLSSSSVGTMAGQVVMQGYLRRRIPLLVRRAVTMAPALIVLAVGVNPSRTLVISQVILSFGIPFALVPLLMFCRDRRLMGALVNRPATTAVATVVVALIVALNGFLLWRALLG